MYFISSLMRLAELMPAPASPLRGFGDWKRFVSVNGFPPPEDYRMLVREYGTGTFGGWLRLIEPFNPGWSFMDKAQVECDRLRTSRQLSPHDHPGWPIWPEQGGLLPWATTATGQHIGWRTEGRPDSWTTLVWSSGDRSGEYAVCAVDFLLALVERNLGDPRFDDETTNPFAWGQPSFSPPDH